MEVGKVKIFDHTQCLAGLWRSTEQLKIGNQSRNHDNLALSSKEGLHIPCYCAISDLVIYAGEILVPMHLDMCLRMFKAPFF